MSAVSPDQWSEDKWTHEAIMAMQARLSPGDIDRIRGQWSAVVDDLGTLFSGFLDDVTKTMGEGWRGPGAQATLRTLRSYVENSRTTFERAQDLSSGLATLSAAAAELREQITAPPSDVAVQRAIESVGSRSGLLTRSLSLHEALDQVRVLYSGPAVLAGNAVAELAGPTERLRFRTVPREPGDDPADTDPAGDDLAGGDPVHDDSVHDDPVRDEQSARAGEFLARLGGPRFEPEAMAGLGADPPQQNSTRTPRTPGWDQADDLAEDDVYANQNWMRDPLGRDIATHSAGTDWPDAPVAGRPGTDLLSDRLPASGTTPNSPVAASVPAGSAGLATRTMGSMVPMMGGFGAHPGQRRGDQNEHYTPPYLINRANTDELLGRLPAGSVPVIGVWDTESDDDRRPPRKRTRPGSL